MNNSSFPSSLLKSRDPRSERLDHFMFFVQIFVFQSNGSSSRSKWNPAI